MINKRYIWTTRDRKEIPIKDMSDSHLINTINFLRRNGQIHQLDDIASAYGVLSSLSGEMATYYCERDIQYMEEESLDEFLARTIPQFPYLLSQARKRRLIK